AFGVALLESVVIRLAPEARMFCHRGQDIQQKRGEKGHSLGPRNAAASLGRWRNKLRHGILSNRSRKQTSRGSWAAAGVVYLIEINTDVEPEMISSMGTDHSPAVDSRNSAELPGSLFWSRTLICERGASGSSLSSTSSVGVGLSRVT